MKLRTAGYQGRGRYGRWEGEKSKAEEYRYEERQRSMLSGSRDCSQEGGHRKRREEEGALETLREQSL